MSWVGGCIACCKCIKGCAKCINCCNDCYKSANPPPKILPGGPPGAPLPLGWQQLVTQDGRNTVYYLSAAIFVCANERRCEINDCV